MLVRSLFNNTRSKNIGDTPLHLISSYSDISKSLSSAKNILIVSTLDDPKKSYKTKQFFSVSLIKI